MQGILYYEGASSSVSLWPIRCVQVDLGRNVSPSKAVRKPQHQEICRRPAVARVSLCQYLLSLRSSPREKQQPVPLCNTNVRHPCPEFGCAHLGIRWSLAAVDDAIFWHQPGDCRVVCCSCASYNRHSFCSCWNDICAAQSEEDVCRRGFPARWRCSGGFSIDLRARAVDACALCSWHCHNRSHSNRHCRAVVHHAKLPVVNGITMSFNNLASAIASVATVPIATIFSWKAPIVAYGAFALTCATAWTIVGRDTQGVTEAAEPSPAHTRDERLDLSFKQILRSRSTALLALAVVGSWCLGNAIGSWLPTYYHQVFKMPLEKASSIMSIVTVGGTAGCVAGGVLPIRVGRRKPFIIIPGIFMGITASVRRVLQQSSGHISKRGIVWNVRQPTESQSVHYAHGVS